MIHRATITKTFSLGFSLAPALLLLSSVTIGYLVVREKLLEVLLSVSLSIGIYALFGLEVSAAVLSMLLVASTLLSFSWFEEFAFWVLVLLTGFEGIALLHWVLVPFVIPSPFVWFADLELSLFYVVAPIAPLLATVIMCMWFLKPMIVYVGIGRFLRSRLNLNSEPRGEEIIIHPRTLLALALTFSVVGALYPYSPNINPNSSPVGVDVHWYIEWMAEVEKNPSSAFTVSRGSRPVMLLMIYTVNSVFGFGIEGIVKYLPIFLNPLLVLSVYFMVSNGSGDVEWAALASLFTSLGFTTTVGMYSYFLTNILGLFLLFSALGFLFNAFGSGSKGSLVSASLLGSLVVFTHPWTFTQYYAATALFLGYRYFVEKVSDGCSTVLIFLGVMGVVDFLKWMVIGGLEGVGSIVLVNPRFMDVADFWNNNVFIFRMKYGGFLSNVVMLGLAALGAYTMKIRENFKLFLISLLVTSSLFYFITHEEIISRLLFNIPFGVFAATGILFLLRYKGIKRGTRIAIFLFTATYMTVYLLRSIGILI